MKKIIGLILIALQTAWAADGDIRIQSGSSTTNTKSSSINVTGMTNLLAGSLTASNLTATRIVMSSSTKQLISATNTGAGSVVLDTSPTIVTPTIASFANANHDHSNSAGGGNLAASVITSGTLAKARGGTAADNSSVTFPSSGTIPTASTLTSGTIPKATGSTTIGDGPILVAATTNITLAGGAAIDNLTATNGATIAGTTTIGLPTITANSGAVTWIDQAVTGSTLSSGTGVSLAVNLDGNTMLKVQGISDGAGAVTNLAVIFPANTNLTSYAAGTAYALTATPAQLDFGTTDPSITLTQTRNYVIRGAVSVKYNAATFADNQTVTLKFRRTNNTAADLSNGSITVTLRIVTTLTDSAGVIAIPDVVYAATAGDIIQIFGSVSATPSAGSLDTDAAWFIALPL